MNNTVFAKTMENARKDRDIKLAVTERRRNYLVLDSNYHTTSFFDRASICNRNERKKRNTYEPVYVGLSILDLSKILMYEF